MIHVTAVVSKIIEAMERIAPPRMALEGDHIGLQTPCVPRIDKILLALDVNMRVVDEAKRRGAGLIITHHPIIFRKLERISGKRLLTILNKSDLPAKLDPDSLPEMLSEKISLSAKRATGIEQLIARIPQICGVTDFDPASAVCFTARQHALLEHLQRAQSKRDATLVITELLNGCIDV